MAADLTKIVTQLRYIVKDHLSPGVPIADALLALADAIEQTETDSTALTRRVEQLERQAADLEKRIPVTTTAATAASPTAAQTLAAAAAKTGSQKA